MFSLWPQLGQKCPVSLEGSDNLNDLDKISKQKIENLITNVLGHLNVHSLEK